MKCMLRTSFLNIISYHLLQNWFHFIDEIYHLLKLMMIAGQMCLGRLVIMSYSVCSLHFTVIVLCCVFDCRIPRTKQEIDANYERRQLKRQLSKQMKRVPPGHQVKVVRGKECNFDHKVWYSSHAQPGIWWDQPITAVNHVWYSSSHCTG